MATIPISESDKEMHDFVYIGIHSSSAWSTNLYSSYVSYLMGQHEFNESTRSSKWSSSATTHILKVSSGYNADVHDMQTLDLELVEWGTEVRRVYTFHTLVGKHGDEGSM